LRRRERSSAPTSDWSQQSEAEQATEEVGALSSDLREGKNTFFLKKKYVTNKLIINQL